MGVRRVVAGSACVVVALAFGGSLMTPLRRAQGATRDEPGNVPTYRSDGEIVPPANYREWVFLSSGFDMSYRERTGVPDHAEFDNVFVNPEAYREFLKSGRWPDKTMMVLENRVARSAGERLVKGGRFQGAEVAGFEIHVKDSARFKRGGVGGDWAFFDVGADGRSKLFEPAANCYSCHAEHAAVDTTFVQFYPTLLGVARAKGTLSEAYRREELPEGSKQVASGELRSGCW